MTAALSAAVDVEAVLAEPVVRWVAGWCARRGCSRAFVVRIHHTHAVDDGWPSTCSKTCATKLNRHRHRQRELAERVRVRAKTLMCAACGARAGSVCRRLLCRSCWALVRTSCVGKFRYTEAAAVAGARRLTDVRAGEWMGAYWCPLSNAWHIGSRVGANIEARIRSAAQVLMTLLPPADLARLLESWDPKVIDAPVRGSRGARDTGAG